MRNYIIRRVLLMIPTLLLVTIIVFLSIRLMPGTVIDQLQDQLAGVGEIDRDELMHVLGLDMPIHIQYGRWIGNLVLHGDLGTSLRTQRAVAEGIAPRVPVSLELGLIGIIVGLLIAIPVGVYSAIRQDTPGDYMGRSIAIGFISIPNFWIGTMVVVFPAIWWQWTPPIQYVPFAQNPIENLGQFMIPGVVLGLVLSGTTMRMARTMMLEVLRQDYVRTAWAKGLTERTVVMRHALRNALIPVLTTMGLNVPIMIGGTVIIEQIFCLPGMGRYFLDALSKRDYTTVCGLNLVIACFILVANLLIDLSYAYLDPRIRYE